MTRWKDSERMEVLGLLNLLKANFTGKVGQVVGAKWKNKSTIRSYTKPAYTNTAAQQVVREVFGEMTRFVALFSDQLKPLAALNTKGMSVRNAIIRLNKEQITIGTFDKTTLLVSRGGLPQPSGVSIATGTPTTQRIVTWTPVVGATISPKAKFVAVFVNEANNFAYVDSTLNTMGTMTIDTTLHNIVGADTYYYLLDYRGSTRVGSMSEYKGVVS